jgi:hypothetical protein
MQIYEQKDFTGGLNLRADQFQLADNESPEMLNVEVDPRGGVFSRGGMRRINSTNVSGTWNPDRLFAFYGANTRLMLANANKVMYQSGTTFVNLEYSAGNAIPTSTGHGACFSAWGKTLYMATGVGSGGGACYKWDGATTYASALGEILTNSDWTAAGKMPRAEHLQIHANKMWAANTIEEGVAFPNRIRWSDESRPEYWTKANSIDLEGGGVGITGMAVVGGSLVVFKPYTIYMIIGYESADFQVVEVTTKLGVLGHQAIAQTDAGLFFYSQNRGLFQFDGANLQRVWEPLHSALDLNYINSADPDSVSVFWANHRVWVSLPYSKTSAATGPTVNVVFDPTLRSFTMFATADSKGVIGGTDFRTTAGEDIGVALHPTVPCVLSLDNYNDPHDWIDVSGNPDGFTTIYRTKWFDAGSYMQRKMFRRPDLVMREVESVQEITVDVFHDFQEAEGSQKRSFVLDFPAGAGGMVWGDDWAEEPAGEEPYGSVWSAGVIGGAIKTARNLGLAKSVQLRFTGDPGKAWGINSIGYKWQPRRVKG